MKSGPDRKCLLVVDGPEASEFEDLKISQNGSRVFSLAEDFIQAQSIQTGEFVGKVEIKYSQDMESLIVDGLRVWAYYSNSEYQGWDFGA